MKKVIIEGQLKFTFAENCHASKYDEWSFYRNQFQNICGGSKAVDILCLSQHTIWLIEIKDFRVHRRTKSEDIGDEIAIKVRDTLAGLVQEGESFRTTQKSKKSDFFKKSDFSVVWIFPPSCTSA